MDVKKLGMIAAAAVTLLAANISLAGAKGDKPFCVPTKGGQSTCKGNGNAGCKGQNSCANIGQMDAKNKAGCEKVGGAWKTPSQVAKDLGAAGETAPTAAPTHPH